MGSLVGFVVGLHNAFFKWLRGLTQDWLVGLSARLVFSSVLLSYFIHSALSKVGRGFPDFLIPKAGAYAQMLPPIAEQVSYDHTQIAFFPWGLVVYMGTYAEFILPLLIFLGLFTRLAALGFMAFIGVMTFVDIKFHGVGAKTIGAFWDRVQDSAIADQRLLWSFPLLVLLLLGPGKISLDYLLSRQFGTDGRSSDG